MCGSWNNFERRIQDSGFGIQGPVAILLGHSLDAGMLPDIPSAARNLALCPLARKNQGEIPRCARNDSGGETVDCRLLTVNLIQ
jgi:hypothetical protein